MGERAARGADHRVEPDAERPGLRRHLLGSQDVAEPAERRMPGGGVNNVGPAALIREYPGAPLQRRVGRRLVLAHGKRMQRRAEQPAEQQVAGSAVASVGVGDALFELDVDVHPEPASPGRGEAGEVRLHRPGHQHGVGAARLRLAEVELELAHLVSPEGEPRAVVALDPQLDPEGRAELRGRVERRRRVAEADSREPVDGGKRAGHRSGRSVRTHAFAPFRQSRSRPTPSAVVLGLLSTDLVCHAAGTRQGKSTVLGVPLESTLSMWTALSLYPETLKPLCSPSRFWFETMLEAITVGMLPTFVTPEPQRLRPEEQPGDPDCFD